MREESKSLMPDRSAGTFAAFWPVVMVVIAMASIQTGAAITKQLFPVVGTTGAAALRLLFAAIILCVVLRPWRLRMTPDEQRSILVYGIAVAGPNGPLYRSPRPRP